MRESVDQSLLRKFYEDREVYDEVREYLYAHLDQLGLAYIYDKQPTVGVADARVVLDNAFKQLDDLFAQKEKPKKSKNESR